MPGATLEHDAAGAAGKDDTEFDVVVIGAGFAGMYMLHRLRSMGLRVRAFEAGDGVGGTWYWNRYPGAQCDVESLDYSYGFDDSLQQDWTWSLRNAKQPEILQYANHVADRFDLRKDIRFETRVRSATFDEPAQQWTIRTDRDDEVTAQFVVMATGCLSNANVPKFPGLDSFTGATYHTGQWPKEGLDLTGKRGRGHRHRFVGHPGDPRDREAGRGALRLPAHPELLTPGAEPPARSQRDRSLQVRLHGRS